MRRRFHPLRRHRAHRLTDARTCTPRCQHDRLAHERRRARRHHRDDLRHDRGRPSQLTRALQMRLGPLPVPGALSPAPRFVYSLGSSRGAISPFGSINRSLVQRTAGLLKLAHLERERDPVHAVEPPPIYGPAFTYTEFMLAGGAVSAFFASFAIVAVFVGITFITPVRRTASCYGHHLLLHSCFTDPVAGQAPGDTARIGARRPVSASLCPLLP